MYYDESQILTVREALNSVGLNGLSDSGYENVRVLEHDAASPIPVNNQGQFWHYCSGSVLFGWVRVSECQCACPGHQGKYHKTSSYMYVVIDVKDNHPFLKIVFSA